MHLIFVHTPLATPAVLERCTYRRNFDIQYHAAHPGQRHMKNNLWELPHLYFAYEIADVIKDLYPTSVVVFGGAVTTPLHQQTAAHPGVDYVAYNRGFERRNQQEQRKSSAV